MTHIGILLRGLFTLIPREPNWTSPRASGLVRLSRDGRARPAHLGTAVSGRGCRRGPPAAPIRERHGESSAESRARASPVSTGHAPRQRTTLWRAGSKEAAAQYSGGGDGAFERLRRALGLGGLDVNLEASGGPSVGLERALNSRVSVGVKAGASAAQTGVGVDIRVTDKGKVQGEVGANGAASVGVGVEHEW